MYKDTNRIESFFHALMIQSKMLKTGSRKADQDLRALLETHKTFENIYNSLNGPMLPFESGQICKGLARFRKPFTVLTINDDAFPDSLRNYADATPVLYTMGDLELLMTKGIAVVGTRKLHDKEDIDEGREIVQRLLNKDLTIVSGLAEGCDTLGHMYAIENGGRTIAVLGTPLDKHYPKKNRSLQDKIVQDHLVVSQYPIGIRTFGSYFAHRNTTTVTLASEGVVVIRADDKSGTQYAVRECTKQKKPLYALRNNLCQGYKWTEKFKPKRAN